MSKNPSIYLQDMVESIELIEQFTEKLTAEDFLALQEKQDAVIRRLEVIGEAARHLTTVFKDLNPVVPWSQIVAMRNRLIHEYGRVDLELTWTVVRRDLPKLKHQVCSILDQLEE